MKPILLLSLLFSMTAVAQVPDTTWVNDLKYPKYTFVSADSAKWVIRVHKDRIEIKGDTASAVMALWRSLEDLRSDKSNYQTLFIRGYEYINQLPDYLKDSTNEYWSRFVIELRKQGYKIPKQKQ